MSGVCRDAVSKLSSGYVNDDRGLFRAACRFPDPSIGCQRPAEWLSELLQADFSVLEAAAIELF